MELVDLNKIILNIETDLELVIQQKKAVIKYENLPAVQGVSFLIYQLLFNLIFNSLKFAKENVYSLIEITAGKVSAADLPYQQVTNEKTSFIEIRIKDNGIGFEPQNAVKIFETFTRLNNRALFEGTGLGLSLCKNIMERHNGFIIAEGEAGIGATFRIFFPE